MITQRKPLFTRAAVFTLLALGTASALSQQSTVQHDSAQQNTTAEKSAPAREYKWKTPKLDRTQVDALLSKPDKLLIVDLRRPDELTKIGGFPVYFSIQVADLEKNLALIPKDRVILTASNHAGRAGAAGDLLTSKGFKVAGAVGVQNYEEEGGKLSKILAPEPKSANVAAAK